MDAERSGRSESVGDGDGGGKEDCDISERQPPLPGRERQFKRGRAGGLCRVCAHTFEVDGDSDGSGGEGYYFSSEPSLFPRERKRLILQTSLIATIGGGGGGGDSGQSDQGRNQEKQEPEGEGREREWPIELREGDSPAIAAREFVTKRLGLAVRPEGTAPKVAPGAASAAAAAAMSSSREGEDGEGTADVAQQEVDSEAAAAGERIVQWVTQTLEMEIAERQVRVADAGKYNAGAKWTCHRVIFYFVCPQGAARCALFLSLFGHVQQIRIFCQEILETLWDSRSHAPSA